MRAFIATQGSLRLSYNIPVYFFVSHNVYYRTFEVSVYCFMFLLLIDVFLTDLGGGGLLFYELHYFLATCYMARITLFHPKRTKQASGGCWVSMLYEQSPTSKRTFSRLFLEQMLFRPLLYTQEYSLSLYILIYMYPGVELYLYLYLYLYVYIYFHYAFVQRLPTKLSGRPRRSQ